MNPARSALLWASRNEWLKTHVPRWSFVRRGVKRFMPGEQLEDALQAAKQLQEKGFFTIFTRLGENITNLEEAAAVRDHYLQVVDAIQEKQLRTEISLKLTQLGLDHAPEKATEFLITIARYAGERDIPVWIDMEDSSYVDVTLAVYRQARQVVNTVGICLQAYLYRTEQDLRELLTKPAAIRLVKGAYQEPPSVAFPRKRDVDANYLKLTRHLLEAKQADASHRLVFGTHDANIIRRTMEMATDLKLETTDYEFHMLYGIATDLQHHLRQRGQQVGVLISYGDAWYPWYMRRLAERPANVWFVLKHLLT